ncbi:MAG: hypothetical protein WD572_01885 [Gammaproteobacteria bacterium]
MTDIQQLRSNETELRHLLEMSEKGSLEQSLRLLGLYVAAYKQIHGELNHQLLAARLNQQEMDNETLQLFSNGLQEAISMLTMIETSRPSTQTGKPAQLLN